MSCHSLFCSEYKKRVSPSAEPDLTAANLPHFVADKGHGHLFNFQYSGIKDIPMIVYNWITNTWNGSLNHIDFSIIFGASLKLYLS